MRSQQAQIWPSIYVIDDGHEVVTIGLECGDPDRCGHVHLTREAAVELFCELGKGIKFGVTGTANQCVLTPPRSPSDEEPKE